MILKSSLQGDFTVTATVSLTEVTGVKIIIPEDGIYLVQGIVACDLSGSTTSPYIKLKLAVNGTPIPASGGYTYMQDTDTGKTNRLPMPISNILQLKKDDEITLYAARGDTNHTILIRDTGATDFATYIEAINLTKLARGGM